MPYSKSPESYSKHFHDLLDMMLESWERIEFPTTEPGKTRSRFYGFINAWKHRAEQAQKMGNMELAAEHQKKHAALLRYMPHKENEKLIFVHKDCLMEYAGTELKATGRKLDDPLLEAASLFAKAQHGVLQKESHDNPVIPGARENDNVALRLFGVDTSKAFERKVTGENMDETPLTEEEKEILRKSGMDI